MVQPLLHGVIVVFRWHRKPLVTPITQYTLGIELADIRVLGEEEIALVELVGTLAVTG
jgi:hypothetical protein